MLLSTLSPKVKKLENFLNFCQRRRYSAKSSVICPGDICETLYLLVKGTLNILIEDEGGKELIITQLQPGDFFGEMGLFDSGIKKQRSALVVAKTDCEVAEISYEKFRKLVEQDIELLYEVIRQMADRLRYTTYKAYDLIALDITGRVTTALQELCRQPGAVAHPDGVQIRVTRQEIARIISCSREMVGRVLKKLEEQGVILTHGKTITVLNALHTPFVPAPSGLHGERLTPAFSPRLAENRTFSPSPSP